MHCRHRQMAYFPVEAGSRIPSARLCPVLKKHRQFVGSFLQTVCDIDRERIVAVRPETDLLSVHEYLGFAHRSVKKEYVTTSVEFVAGDFKSSSVGSLAHIRKSSCASGLVGCSLFAVLDYSHGLKVIAAVERSEYRPVMRHSHLFPSLCGLYVMASSEFPFLQKCFASFSLGERRNCAAQCCQKHKDSFHMVVFFHSPNGSKAAVGRPSAKAPREYAFHPSAS